jgi:hypothetical protein
VLGFEITFFIEQDTKCCPLQKPGVSRHGLLYILTELSKAINIELTRTEMASADCSNISERRPRYEVTEVTNVCGGPFTSVNPLYRFYGDISHSLVSIIFLPPIDQIQQYK